MSSILTNCPWFFLTELLAHLQTVDSLSRTRFLRDLFYFSAGMHHFLILTNHTNTSPSSEEKRGASKHILWVHCGEECHWIWEVFFMCQPLLCASEGSPLCGQTPWEKRGDWSRCLWYFCGARGLKRAERSSAVGSSRPERRDNATGQLWRPTTIKNAASWY